MGIRAYNRGSRLLADEATRLIEASQATNDARARLWRDLLQMGAILHFRCPNGETVTAGPHVVAVGPASFSAYRDGTSRWCGFHIGSAWGVALFILEHVGRARPFRVSMP